MSKTIKNPNVINNEKSDKFFKKKANRKLRRNNNISILTENFDNLMDNLNEVSNVYTSQKEWKIFEV